MLSFHIMLGFTTPEPQYYYNFEQHVSYISTVIKAFAAVWLAC